jgi:lipid-binding SYLF domain-containing protein
MRKLTKWMAAILVFCLMLVPVMADAATAQEKAEKKEQQRQELRVKTYKVLKDLYEKKPKSKRAIEHAYGYAVFVDTSYTAGFIGGGHGRGRAVNQSNGKEIFMKMAEGKLGLGIGVRQSNIVFVFDTIDAFTSFVSKGWTFGGQAVAAATDDVHGDALEGSFQVAPGMWMYQMTTKGLAAELTAKGTRFYVDNDLNETKIPKVTSD